MPVWPEIFPQSPLWTKGTLLGILEEEPSFLQQISMNQIASLPVSLVLVAVRPLPLAEGELPSCLSALLDEVRAFREGLAHRDIWWCAASATDEAGQLQAALAEACEAAGLPRPLVRPLASDSRDCAALLRELADALAESLAGCVFFHHEEDGRRALWLLGRGSDTRRARALAAVTPLTLEGISCAEITEAGKTYRLGASRSDWREALLAVGRAPFAAEEQVREAALRDLGQRGVWLGDGQAEPLAVMCCGQGSVWPGMGRELYDQFPAARAAMDRLAAVADWDVLSLLDERDEEKIGLTRWQQPYLFLLEYAQWSHLASLGLKPSLLCGHSLGELIALCLAGVYAPETAWYILDTRAQHMSELEARATRETGMMAVHAEAQLIEEARRLWPALYVSNYNTPKQYIVSGPRDMLMEARKHFRKQRLPAIMLNVSLAFHHPAMRVLRDMSLRRLNALAMQSPQLPLLSCVTTGFYPQQQWEICEYIADLDENAVRWVECVRQMWTRDGIRHFVELGPQDTLCGLVTDIEPRSLCLSASRKGHEAEGLRRTCAQLYALGHLPAVGLKAHAARWEGTAVPAAGPVSPASRPVTDMPPLGPLARRIVALLEETAGLPAGSVTPQWDLRYDLSLRSSRFPLLVQQLETVLGRSVSFEALMGVMTVGDLLAAVGLSSVPAGTAATDAEAVDRAGPADVLDRRPFLRYAADADGHWRPAAWDPVSHGPGVRPDGAVLVWSDDGERAARLLEGLAALGQTLIIPPACETACRRLERLGCSVRCLDPATGAGEGASAADFLRVGLAFLREECMALSGCLLDGPCDTEAEGEALRVLRERDDTEALWLRRIRVLLPEELEAFTTAVQSPDAPAVIGILEDGLPPLAQEWGDMFAREILLACESPVLWARAECLGGLLPQAVGEAGLRLQPWRERPEVFPGLFARQEPPRTASGRDFLLSGEFSRYARPWLADCGGGSETDLPCLPPSQALRSLLDGARIAYPWLYPNGLCDVRLGEPLPLPPGITRETRLDIRARSWLRQDGVMTRMCHCRLEARGLTDNGRHTDRWLSVMEGMALLGRTAAGLPALWESGSDADTEGTWADGDGGLAGFYGRRAIGAASRLLGEVLPDGQMFKAGGDRGEAWPTVRFALDGKAVAPEGVSGYTTLLRLVDAVEQGAWLAQEKWFDDGTAAWRMTGIGFIRFAGPDDRQAAVLELRCGWRTGQLRRFDAQICDACGRALLTLNQMEFERSLPVQA